MALNDSSVSHRWRRWVGWIARRHRVDDVPLMLRPFYLLYGYGTGLLAYFYSALVHRTSVIEHDGTRALPQERHCIFAIWHQYAWVYMAVFRCHRRHVWLSHPLWYMKPAHVLMRLIGIERIILGSTGHSGREAADVLLEHLRAGASTLLSPDGPNGPARHARKGILHLAAQSGIPIFPLRFCCSRSLTLPGWDQKILPLPFGKITVRNGRPIRVDDEPGEAALLALEAEL